MAVVAPAGIYDPERLKRGMDLGRSWGLEFVDSPHLGDRHRYLAGTAEARSQDLRWALSAGHIDAVWFARGGYGTVQTLDALPDRMDRRPIIGFSDATALHVALRGRGRPIHGPVLNALAALNDADSQEALRALLLEGGTVHLSGERVAGPSGAVRGPVTGGNLTVLASLCGTRDAWSAAGQIVVLEDVGEAPYRLDRALTQLLRAGAFVGARGIALGEFVSCKPPEGADWTLLDVLLERLGPLGVPIVAGLPVGHGARNHAWPVGGAGVLDAEGLHVDAG